MDCYRCGHLAGFAEPVPGTGDTVRPVCALCKGPDARPFDPAVLLGGWLLGGTLDWPEDDDG